MDLKSRINKDFTRLQKRINKIEDGKQKAKLLIKLYNLRELFL